MSGPQLGRLAAIAALTLCGTFTEGSVVKSIDLGGWGPDVPSLFHDLGHGLTLEVTAGIHSGRASANAPLDVTGGALITQRGGSEAGIGVRSSRYDSSQLDAFGPNEFLRFEFNEEVTLQWVVFESALNTRFYLDEFDAGLDGVDLQITDTFGTDTLRSFPGAGLPGGTDRIVDFTGGVDFAGDGTDDLQPATGMVFDFYTDDFNDSYRIRALGVGFDKSGSGDDDGFLMPEAASSLTWLGLLGMAAAKRRWSA